MRFFDFLKKEKETRERKTILFSNLFQETETELRAIENKIQNIKEQIRQRISQLSSELKEKIAALRNINLEDRKEQEKIKIIVKENLALYISYLQRLIEQLETLDYKDKNYLTKIDSAFNNFKIASTKSFEKATILIGKELDEVRDSMKKFSKNFDSIMIENKEIFEKEKIANSLNELLLELKQREEAELKIKNSLQNLEQNFKELEEKKKAKEKELENIKNSDSYIKALEEKEELRQKIEKTDEELFRLKQEIKLKYLSKLFHQDKKKSQIIKMYIEKFKEALQQDVQLEICSIIKEVNPNFDAEKLKEIRLKNIEFKKLEDQKAPIETQIKDIEEEIKKLALELLGIKNIIEQEKKKIERLQEKENEVKKEIKNQVRALWHNIEIIEK